MVTRLNIPPIPQGYPYAVYVQARPATVGDPVAFPIGCTLLADVALIAGGDVIATLSTEAGSIERISDDTILLRFSPVETAPLTNTYAVLDLVRTDCSPDIWLDLTLELPVHKPITTAREES